ncbi:type IA DNA topoisomerase [Mycoplasma putrefaciens]|uniref:DNA topoisomerase 1 n=1 Tax=Mycoplasma putrefaciens Mput9231 TaxID=1292033 RepID=M9WBJ4_9MOLU|nr:type IA DNA topoisomerase [Mycoplasma putrefaciens]AGJ90492.1 DNA topoisomerase I [Mycoplasma putrefaciens Mput9231]
MKVLVLLESPSKISKIQQYLQQSFPDNQYTVLASGGHIAKIADKGTWGLGIDFQTMQPEFVLEKTRSKIVSEIKKEGKKADLIVLASDPDREGEAIAWHLAKLFEDQNKEIKRATFNEITKEAVSEAFNNLREIDMNLVQAQFARQMLDKIIGYLVSKSLQKSTGLMSAGRVQTPALNILATRDEIIKKFKETLYKKIFVIDKLKAIRLVLTKDKNDRLVNTEKTYYITDQQAKEIVEELTEIYKCTDYKSTTFETRSFKPYSTAGLLQDGFSKLKLSAGQITLAAQKLYELGYITYIRTDSVKYSDHFIKDAKEYINKNYSEELFKEPVAGKKDLNSQEAHESIRPTDIWLTPEKAKLEIQDTVQQRVYSLIWWNSIKSLMKGPSGFNHRWTFKNNNYEFKQSWQEVLDLGYQAIKHSSSDENIELNEDEEVEEISKQKPHFEFNKGFELKLSKKHIKVEDAKTNPPKMFNQASLIKELKNLGIGRPSTYNPILTKLKDRQYVEYPRSKPITVTTKGYEANNFLYQHYKDFFNLNYTAEMEEKLDRIIEGDFDYQLWLSEIFASLDKKVKEEISQVTTDVLCPRCKQANLTFIKSKFNRGRGCSNFTKTGCGYREYEQPDGTWKEYVPAAKEQDYKQEKN